jgi:hypothetical protein
MKLLVMPMLCYELVYLSTFLHFDEPSNKEIRTEETWEWGRIHLEIPTLLRRTQSMLALNPDPTGFNSGAEGLICT